MKKTPSFYGTWTVKNYKFGNSITAFNNEQQASLYLDKKIVLSPGRAEIFGDECNLPSYSITRNYTKDLFYQEFNESDTTVISGVDSVYVMVVSCLSAPVYKNPDSLNFIHYLVYFNNLEMMAHINGAYFFLQKE